MTDEEIVLYFNEHRLAKLESYLLKDGSSVEHELQNLLDRFYEQIVPEHERMEVEAQIELEREREAAQREASRRNTISVCESSGNAWRTYDLKDVSAAMYKAERKEGLSLDARHEIFAVALEGKEITFDDSEDESPDLQM